LRDPDVAAELLDHALNDRVEIGVLVDDVLTLEPGEAGQVVYHAPHIQGAVANDVQVPFPGVVEIAGLATGGCRPSSEGRARTRERPLRSPPAFVPAESAKRHVDPTDQRRHRHHYYDTRESGGRESAHTSNRRTAQHQQAAADDHETDCRVRAHAAKERMNAAEPRKVRGPADQNGDAAGESGSRDGGRRFFESRGKDR
jgi:hypothetical protein